MSFIDSIRDLLAQEQGIYGGGALLPPGIDRQPQWPTWSTEKAISDGFKASTWVYAGLRAIATCAASVPWYVEGLNAKGDWERIEGHPLEVLLHKPNDFTDRSEMVTTLVYHLGLAGNALLWISGGETRRGQTLELFPFGPAGVKYIPSKVDWIEGYEFERDGVRECFDASEVIHFKFVDPSNPYWGISPLQAAARVIDTDVSAVSWNKVSLQNRGVVDAVIAFDAHLTESQLKEAEKSLKEKYAGAGNARKLMIVGGGGKVQTLALSPVDMDFIEGRKMGREEILTAMGVPPTFFGIGDPTYSNFSTAEKVLWRNTVIPLLDALAGVFERTLLPRFGDDPSKLWLRYDTTNVQALKPDLVGRASAFQIFTGAGVPANSTAEMLELPIEAIEGGDVPNGLKPTPPMPFLPMGGDPFKRKGWRPGERKAARASVAAANREADKVMASLGATFLDAVQSARKGVNVEALAVSLAAGEDVGRALPFEELEAKLLELAPELERAFVGSAKVTAGQVADSLGKPAPVPSPATAELWAKQRARALARSIVDGCRKSVATLLAEREQLLRAPQKADEPSVWTWLASLALQFFGLSAPQATKLIGVIVSSWTGGASRKAVFDEARKLARGLEAERATWFAQDQAQAAVNRGRREVWESAEQEGLIDASTKRTFLTADDESVCPICAPMDGQTIGLHEKFYSAGSGEFYDGPGPEEIHPRCRCGELITSFGAA